ncbi:hypothetical protein NE237_009821 [Protea cynaroides]|uniref:Uncharacterized protein n=1 Tax=Protea cynaroides TaxID=273540 RepID=A0A9Q0KZC7_9MAGN|nr:hypothetical protein NE237_009821 [Protea cynaroides]
MDAAAVLRFSKGRKQGSASRFRKGNSGSIYSRGGSFTIDYGRSNSTSVDLFDGRLKRSPVRYLVLLSLFPLLLYPLTPPLLPVCNRRRFKSLKLTSDNYFIMENQLMPLLRSYNLVGYVGSSKPCPPLTLIPEVSPAAVHDGTSSLPNLTYDEWNHKDQLVLSWLIAFLTVETQL